MCLYLYVLSNYTYACVTIYVYIQIFYAYKLKPVIFIRVWFVNMVIQFQLFFCKMNDI